MEALCCYTPANWGPLHSTSPRLLSQSVVIDFSLLVWNALTFDPVNQLPDFLAAVALMARRRCSPPLPTKCTEVSRGCAFLWRPSQQELIPPVSYPSPVFLVTYSEVPTLKRRPSFWRELFLNTVKYLHLCALSCAGAVSKFMEVSPTAPPALFYVVSSLTTVCLSVWLLLSHRWTRCVACLPENRQACSPQAQRSRPQPRPHLLRFHLLLRPNHYQKTGWRV